MLSRGIPLLVLVFATMASPTALAANSCKAPIVVENPPLDVLCPECALRPELSGIRVKELRFEVEGPIEETTQGRTYKVMRVSQTIDFDVNSFRENFRRRAVASTPRNECRHNYHPHGFKVSPTNGDALGEYALRYKMYYCASFRSVCCRKGKCRKCTERVSTFLVQNTFDIDVPFRPNTLDENRALEITPGPVDVDDHGFKRNMQGLGALTGALIGSVGGSIWSTAGGLAAWDAVGAAIDKQMPAMPRLEAIAIGGPPGEEDTSPEAAMLRKMRYLPAKSRFYGSPSDIGLAVVKQGRETQGVFCKLVRPRLEEYAAYLRSFSQTDTEVTVEEGDSLWKIAERHYGNGRYWLPIAEENYGSMERVPSKLRSGQKLLVPPMHELLKQRYIVNAGDNLWAIADAVGGVETPAGIATKNSTRVPNRDLIYPLQRLKVDDVVR
jgi:nucleoid-associated protein YgaU